MRDIKQFLSDTFAIRKMFELENEQINYKVFNYNKYLKSNNDIIEYLKDVLTSTGRKVLFEAPTGSGKTYTILDLFNDVIELNKNDEYAKLGFGRVAINILFTPKRIQNKQNEKEYTNVKSITAGDKIEIADIIENRNLSIVYDKASDVIDLINDIATSDIYNNAYYFNVVVDECHLLTSAQNYRSNALTTLLELTKIVIKNNGNVIWTSGTTQNCSLLDFNEYVVCNSGKVSNIGKIVEYTNYESKIENYVFNVIKDELKQGNTPVLRYNNKNLIDRFKDNFKGLAISILTSEEQNNNEVYDTIVEKGVLLKKDLHLWTCLVDEGVSIKSMEDGTHPTNLVPIFILDNQTSLLDFKQFTNRFRWDLDKAILIVDKHEQILDETIVSLVDIVKNESKSYLNDLQGFKGLEVYVNSRNWTDKQKQEFVEQQLNDKDFFGRYNHRNVFSWEDNEIKFNYLAAYRKIFNMYMFQLFNYDIERHCFLRELFGVEVKEMVPELGKDEMIDYVPIKFDTFMGELVKDKELQNKLVDGQLKEFKEIKKDKRFEQLIQLVKYTNDFVSISNTLTTHTNKEVNEIITNYEKNDIATLDNKEMKMLEVFIKTNDSKVLDIKNNRVVNGSYYPLIQNGLELGLELSKMKDVIGNTNINGFEYYLKEEQMIQKNKMFKQKVKLAGNSNREHFYVVTMLEEYKKDKSEMVLNDLILNDLLKMMCKTCSKDWTKNKLKKYIKLVYNYREENKKIIIKSLRLKHS